MRPLSTLWRSVSRLFARSPSRQERRRAFQREIAADYARAGADPEFHAAMRKLDAEFEGATAEVRDEVAGAR